jgi:hypothetical protein
MVLFLQREIMELAYTWELEEFDMEYNFHEWNLDE